MVVITAVIITIITSVIVQGHPAVRGGQTQLTAKEEG